MTASRSWPSLEGWPVPCGLLANQVSQRPHCCFARLGWRLRGCRAWWWRSQSARTKRTGTECENKSSEFVFPFADSRKNRHFIPFFSLPRHSLSHDSGLARAQKRVDLKFLCDGSTRHYIGSNLRCEVPRLAQISGWTACIHACNRHACFLARRPASPASPAFGQGYLRKVVHNHPKTGCRRKTAAARHPSIGRSRQCARMCGLVRP